MYVNAIELFYRAVQNGWKEFFELGSGHAPSDNGRAACSSNVDGLNENSKTDLIGTGDPHLQEEDIREQAMHGGKSGEGQ